MRWTVEARQKEAEIELLLVAFVSTGAKRASCNLMQLEQALALVVNYATRLAAHRFAQLD